ncbi:protein rep, partial [Salinivibrio socompensis]|uniref:protein rep n=1 Tax=Salinivibrio socompensis TaxID=1510206 RepID=UPI0030B80795
MTSLGMRTAANLTMLARYYAGVLEFERYAQRMAECSGVLRFGWQTAPDTGESRLRLREAHFCRVRHCPVCQWRRTLMWQARFYQAMPRLAAEHPKARWIFLTLTVKNCQISELRDTLKHMNASWQRLKDRKEFKTVSGWIARRKSRAARTAPHTRTFTR